MGTEPSLQVAENEASDSCPDDELLLVERLKKRDARAFQELIDLHGETLRTLIGRLMAFDPEMEDVLQNTFVQVWQKIPSFRSQSSIRTWITRIAINQTRNHQRSVRRWLRHFQDRFTLETTEKEQPCIVESTQDPRWDSIQLAMKKLPYRDREILVLVYLEEKSILEIADSMNEKKNTLEVRLHRAKKLLKQTIEGLRNDS